LKDGHSTKIPVVIDPNRILPSVTTTAGQKGEAPEFPNVMQNVSLSIRRKHKRPRAVACDKAYSSKTIRRWLKLRHVKNVIPRRSTECQGGRFAFAMYRHRNVVEPTIGHLKEFRRVAPRYDKPAQNYMGADQARCRADHAAKHLINTT